MKLCTYDTGNGPRAGVIVAERVLDVATLLGEQGGLRDIRALLDLPNDPLTRLQSALGAASAAQAATTNLRTGSSSLNRKRRRCETYRAPAFGATNRHAAVRQRGSRRHHPAGPAGRRAGPRGRSKPVRGGFMQRLGQCLSASWFLNRRRVHHHLASMASPVRPAR